MSAQPPPVEQYPIFNKNNFNDIQGYLTIAQANLLYARLYAVNTLTRLNVFQSPILVNNINISNAGTAQTNIFFTIDLTTAITTGYNNISIGSQSLKFITTGYQNIALGVYSGYNFIIGASDNISIGANTNSDPLITPAATIGAIAIGSSANCNGNSSTSIGYFSDAIFRATAIGGFSQCLSNSSVAIGYGSATSGGGSSVSIGVSSSASNVNAISIGNTSISSGNSSLAIGHTSTSSGLYSIAIGDSAISNVNQSIAIGPSSTASGNSAIVIGYTSSATATSSICIGDTSSATAVGSIALGHLSTSAGVNSTAIGLSSSTGVFTSSTSLGTSATATANNQIMMGTVAETVQMPNALNVIGNATFTLPIFLSQPLMNYSIFTGTTANKQGHTTTSTTLLNTTTGVSTSKDYASVSITSAIGIGSYFVEGMVSFTSPIANSPVDLWINTVSATQDSTRDQTFMTNGIIVPANWRCRITTQLNITAVPTSIYISGSSLNNLTIGSVSLRVVRL